MKQLSKRLLQLPQLCKEQRNSNTQIVRLSCN